MMKPIFYYETFNLSKKKLKSVYIKKKLKKDLVNPHYNETQPK